MPTPRRRWPALAAAALALAGAGCGPERGDRPPNIVLVVADDLGWRDAGHAGSDFYDTPHLDRLAYAGVRFGAAYAAAGNCAPSRASLLSGQYTPRHGVYAVGRTDRGHAGRQRLRAVPGAAELAPGVVTLAEALRDAGYATAAFGKWQLGEGAATSAAAQGFDLDATRAAPGDAEFAARRDPKAMFELTRAAGDFIERQREGPFFVYLAHHAPHWPFQARPDSLERFASRPPGRRHHHVGYAAMLADLDASLGQLLERIDGLGLAGRTLVVFTSDNGGVRQSSPAPLRGIKGTYYEGGLRVPLIARGPGVAGPGRLAEVPVHHVDLYPTLLELAGAAPPAGQPLDGRSLLPLLLGEPGAAAALAERPLFWHFPGYLAGPWQGARSPGFRAQPLSAIRRGDWKLQLFHEEWLLDGGRAALPGNRAVELYDLAADPGEARDLAAQESGRRDALLDELVAWLDAVEAPLPARPDADPVGEEPRRAGGGTGAR